MMSKATSNTTVKIVEEIFNSLTHGLGVIAGIIGLILGIILISSQMWFKIGFIVYVSSLIILMLSSTLYHALNFTKANKVFRVIDHSSIFLLIAGTFTPFAIYLYQGWARVVFLVIIWLIAVVGISINTAILLPKNMKITRVIIYVCFGWVGLFFIPKMEMVSPSVIWLLVLGGVLYTLGVIPFALKKPFAHFSWHLFVIAAACAHFFAVIKLIY